MAGPSDARSSVGTGRGSVDPFGTPLGSPRSSLRDSIYDDDFDDFDDGRTPSWPRSSGSSLGSRPSYDPSRPAWLDDPSLGSAPRGTRVASPLWVRPRGGWKSPRKRKPRGTKKYHSKV